ncbi:hypothetical protein M427DRAFT_39933 [Gonapodya prolifera JEL478]|uniref:Uncharacterized protein n=1 Tax=Gonapodya prolifera (strain JEL478) TaxID=1344416 RepID=A0A138ZWD5_GONPJ|nr:hypothetical protein M427DRAFT_39933 [Gonapodya prolifera JEL478]|eukprot:KXS08807.1 hypothetical protein M427DRAFT_39933 [Gonapodya prolifera JEL478]
MYFAGSDTDEETPSDKDMIDDGDEGDQGAGKGGDDENLPPPQPGKPPVGAETKPTQVSSTPYTNTRGEVAWSWIYKWEGGR